MDTKKHSSLEITPNIDKNRSKNSVVCEFGCEIIEFCPNLQFSFQQGTEREFCGIFPISQSAKQLLPISAQLRKLIGKAQEFGVEDFLC